MKKFLGWTEKQWAASIMASLYGGPAMVALFHGSWGVALCFSLVAYFLFWALSTAGNGRRA